MDIGDPRKVHVVEEPQVPYEGEEIETSPQREKKEKKELVPAKEED